MQLQSIGVQNTVACLGSAWNVSHFNTLNKVATKVCFIPDSDVLKPGQKLPHGIKVVTEAGRLALEKGLSVYVKEIPASDDKSDADSYFRSEEIFDNLPEQDFILWYAEKLFSNSSCVDDKTIALNSVANVLSIIEDSAKRDFYIDQLKKYTGGQKKTWKDAIKLRKTSTKASLHPIISMTNTADSRDFGFITRDCHYLIEDKEGIKTLSNFILSPLYHVQDSVLSRRIFMIENTQHEKDMIELRSEELVSNDKFEAKVGEIGNYVWWGGKADLKRLKGYLFANMKTAQLIKQLGWKREGFFAFGNGIYDKDGWHEADQYGIVSLEGQSNYYLPSHSLKYRYDHNMFQFEHSYTYQEGSTVTLREVTDQIFKVFGENGQVTFMFLLASIFHDIIANASSPRWFPILDLFGPMGTGKTALAELVMAFFIDKKGPNFNNTTLAALSEEVGAAANSVVVFNEYKNDLPEYIIEFLKGVWDLIGRTRMSLNKDGQKETTSVDSGVIITGQEMPTKDPALFGRTIFLAFSKSKFSPEEVAEFNKITDLKKRGLKHLTMDILKNRDKIEKEYKHTFDEINKELLEGTSDSAHVNRIVNNWSVPLAVYKVLKDELNIGINYNNIRSFIIQSIKRQSIASKTSDELASFWNTLQYLLSEKKIYPEGHFRIIPKRFLKPEHGKEQIWDEPHAVLYLRKAGIIEMYQEASRRIGNNFMPKESLEHYIKINPNYLGEARCRFKEFDKGGYPKDSSKSCSMRAYCFEYTKLQEMYGLEFDSTNDDGEASTNEEPLPF